MLQVTEATLITLVLKLDSVRLLVELFLWASLLMSTFVSSSFSYQVLLGLSAGTVHLDKFLLISGDILPK